MLFDTDVFIWAQRGNRRAMEVMAVATGRFLSVQTVLEFLQCAQNRRQQDEIKDFLLEFGFKTLPFSEAIGTRAVRLIEDYSLSFGLRAGDAIIAATALESGLPLMSGNEKHFRAVRGLDSVLFKPD
jgi:hypothetical protein